MRMNDVNKILTITCSKCNKEYGPYEVLLIKNAALCLWCWNDVFGVNEDETKKKAKK